VKQLVVALAADNGMPLEAVTRGSRRACGQVLGGRVLTREMSLTLNGGSIPATGPTFPFVRAARKPVQRPFSRGVAFPARQRTGPPRALPPAGGGKRERNQGPKNTRAPGPPSRLVRYSLLRRAEQASCGLSALSACQERDRLLHAPLTPVGPPSSSNTGEVAKSPAWCSHAAHLTGSRVAVSTVEPDNLSRNEAPKPLFENAGAAKTKSDVFSPSR
jgi:hypothetical protein